VTTPATHQRTYLTRINRVIDHIGTHLADPLDLATLADVANFSPWHFHRVFLGATGETLADCVRRMRLEASAQRLVNAPTRPALHIALDVGFASAPVFTRAFGAHFGMTPTAWRRGGWRGWAAQRHVQLSKIRQGLSKQHQAVADLFRNDPVHWPQGRIPTPKGLDMNIEIKTLPARRVAYMRYTGPYGHPGIGQTWGRFMAWCGQHGLLAPRPNSYGIAWDNAEITPPERCRYDCCVEVGDDFKPQGDVGVQTFAGGRYACARFTGTGADIAGAWMAFYSQWLPQSGHAPADSPCVELYEPDFVVDEKTGAFQCWLCVPVKPL